MTFAHIARPHSFSCSATCSTSAVFGTSSWIVAVLVTRAVPTCVWAKIALAQTESAHSFSCSASCSTSALLKPSSKMLAVLTTTAVPTCV